MPTRRELLIKSSVAAIVAGVDKPLGLTQLLKPEAKLDSQPEIQKVEPLTLGQILQSALDLPPHSEERKRWELQFLGKVAENPNLSDIDKGFWVAANPSVRAQLLDLRWALREEGKDGLKPVPQDKLKWAISNRIHPEILAISLDSYEAARNIVDSLNKSGKLRDDGTIFEDPNEPMINPGGMARLIHYETNDTHHFSPYAFTNIGGGSAIEQLNPLVFPSGKSDLEELCLIMSEKTGLTFNPGNIPGSLWQNPSNNGESGGAIPPIQLMPSNALRFYKLAKSEGYDLNVFDLKDAVKLAWIFLARHEDVGVGFRVGYRKSSPVDQENALLKWNQDSNILKVKDVAIDYFNKFLDESNEKVYPY